MILYFHRNPQTLQVFYVGIGTSEKRANSFYQRSLIWNRYVEKHGNPIVDVVITGLSKEQAMSEEIYLIKYFGRVANGGILFNISDGGETGSNLVEYVKANPEKNPMFRPEIVSKFKGDNNSSKRPEVREKLRVANIGKKASIETRIKQSIAKKGKPSNQPKGYKHSTELIQRMRVINKEIVNRPEVKSKLRLSMLGKRNVGRHTPVIMIDKDSNQEIKTFQCIMDASRSFGNEKSSNITSVCKGRRSVAFGYKWKFA